LLKRKKSIQRFLIPWGALLGQRAGPVEVQRVNGFSGCCIEPEGHPYLCSRIIKFRAGDGRVDDFEKVFRCFDARDEILGLLVRVSNRIKLYRCAEVGNEGQCLGAAFLEREELFKNEKWD